MSAHRTVRNTGMLRFGAGLKVEQQDVQDLLHPLCRGDQTMSNLVQLCCEMFLHQRHLVRTNHSCDAARVPRISRACVYELP